LFTDGIIIGLKFMSLTEQLNKHPNDYVDLALSPWQNNILAGNNAYQRGAFLEARDKYMAAWTLATHLLDQFCKVRVDNNVLSAIEHCCPAVVVAAHNLSDCYLAMGQATQACHKLCDAHELVSNLRLHPDEDIARIASHHLNKTRQELLHFASHHPHFPELIVQVNSSINIHIERSVTLH
jgi:coenzyme F420-reducing hydrogenase delta subunit